MKYAKYKYATTNVVSTMETIANPQTAVYV